MSRLTFKSFKDRLTDPYYDYSKCDEEFFNNKYKKWQQTKLPIICPEHGLFYQTGFRHVKSGCPKCNYKITREIFLEKVNSHLDTSLITKEWWNKNYQSLIKTKAPIVCKFTKKIYEVQMYSLYHGKNYKGYEKYNMMENINKNSTYDYSLITQEWWDKNYKGNQQTKLPIICPEHGLFYQTRFGHNQGNGCPNCNSSKGESKIRAHLNTLELYYIQEFQLDNKQRIDFYIPEYNLAIEYDGIQHFKAVEHFGGEEALASNKERDEIKNQYCIDNNINLLRIPYWEFDNIDILIQEEIEYIYIKGKI
jgi:very-short-patch-repair endonuclease